MTAPSSVAAAELFTRENDDGVVTLTLNTPQNLNALSLAMIEALIAEFEAIADDDQARVVVLTGLGAALSAGHDLKEMQAHRNDCDGGRGYYVELFARCSALMQAIVALPKPVIAAVEGVATAAGCQLVAACDLAIAGEKARFGLSGVNFGLFCTTPAGGGRPRHLAQARDGDGDDRTALQRRGGRAFRPRQPRRSRRPRRSKRRRRSPEPSRANRVRRWRSASAPSTPRSSSRSTRPMRSRRWR